MRFRKKIEDVDAVRWYKHGDHPDVRVLLESDDHYFIGYEGITLELQGPRESYGVIGSIKDPLRLVSPGDWVFTRIDDGKVMSMSPKLFHSQYERLLDENEKST